MKSHCLVVFVFPVSEFQMKSHEGRKSVFALKTKMIHFTQCYVRLFNENALKKSEMQRGKKNLSLSMKGFAPAPQVVKLLLRGFVAIIMTFN